MTTTSKENQALSSDTLEENLFTPDKYDETLALKAFSAVGM